MFSSKGLQNNMTIFCCCCPFLYNRVFSPHFPQAGRRITYIFRPEHSVADILTIGCLRVTRTHIRITVDYLIFLYKQLYIYIKAICLYKCIY